MLCYRCGAHVKDGADKCPGCGQPFALGMKPGSAGFGQGSRRHRVSIEGAPYKAADGVSGRFQIKDALGAGPLGWVFRAHDIAVGEDVALKVLSPRFLQTDDERSLFLSESKRIQALDHPNIARVFAAGLDGDKPWIAQQFLEGLTLQRIIDLRRQKGQGFALREVEPIVAQIAAALDAAAGTFPHGNLKPDNVVVLPDLLKLTDFALATSLPRAPFAAAQKAAGVQRFFPPDAGPLDRPDARTDVWSLGVMLGEMLTGLAWEPGVDLLAKNPDLPKGVAAVFQKATAPRAQDRFADAVELADALTAVTEGGEPARRAHTPPPQPAAKREDDDVVVESAQTDPRVRIARQLAEVEASKVAEKLQQPAKFERPPAFAPAPFVPSAPPPAMPVAVPAPSAPAAAMSLSQTPSAPVAMVAQGGAQSQADIARVAASVGATPELLTAETAVKPNPLTPVSTPRVPPAPPAAPQTSAPPAPLAAAPVPPAPPAPQEPEGQAEDDASEGDDVERERKGRRGRGRKNRREEVRGRRAGSNDPEWAAATGASATAIGVQTPAFQALPAATVEEVAKALDDKPAVAPAAVAEISPSRPPGPTFGGVSEQKKLPVPFIAIGLVVLIALGAWGVSKMSSDAPPEKEAAKADEKKADTKPVEAAKADAPKSDSKDAAKPEASKAEAKAETAKADPKPEAAARPPEPEAKAAPVAKAEKPAPAKAEKPEKAEAPSKADKKKSFLDRLKERREARKQAQEAAVAEAAAQRAAKAEKAKTDKASAPTPAKAPAAAAPAAGAAPGPAAAPAPEAAKPPPGAIAGLGDDDLMVSKSTSKRAAQELASAAPNGSGAAPAKPADPAPKAAATALAAAPSVGQSESSCPYGMRLIPGGAAHVGTDAADDLRNFGDRALASVDVKAYCMDLYEWPNQPGKLPKVGAAFSEAEASCKRDGKRLCSEDEWEKACKGPSDLRFPYGGGFDADACNTQDRANTPRRVTVVGAFTRCKSGYGLFDLSGNAAEWTTSAFEGGTGDKAVKGGSATRPSFDDRCSSRRRLDPGKHDVNVGFRCCADPK
ncbi:MAG: SUMF1/EgtB/PvdO family nonheme iron enzyme [Deltaproteobacteria bacterium]|nr:SUMF1/EgtB/PvdO family nonheme iron enzyme [Deltaproteobacteria bacterium]